MHPLYSQSINQNNQQMKYIFSLLLLMVIFPLKAQVDPDIGREIASLKKQVTFLRIEIAQMRKSFESHTKNAAVRIDSLDAYLQSTHETIEQTQQDLSQVDQTSRQKIADLDSTLTQKSLYWIIAFLAVALLSALVYVLLGNRIRSERTSIEGRIAATKKALEEESVKLDTKLTEIIEAQMKIAQNETVALVSTSVREEPDHSLALKVADEITRINKNLMNMDPATKGLKQLAASVKRIEENFAANGYDAPNLLDKKVSPGMKLIITNTIPDENLKAGEEVITRIIKPQVNYKGVMIQAAQVEVSVGQ